MREGLCHVRWKGRLEAICFDPPIILDGAHNPQGVTSFTAFLSEMEVLSEENPCEVIMGVMADKDVSSMLDILVENWCVPVGRITLVTPDQKRAMPAADLRNAWDMALRRSKEFYNLESCMYNAREKLIAVNNVETACRNAVERAFRNHAPVYMIGSLYLLGEARGYIEDGMRALGLPQN